MLGGGVGAGLRHLVGMMSLRLLGSGFPFGTLAVNLFGSFAMGVFISWLAVRSSGDQSLRYFLATGVLGGFTTFSAFSLDFAFLWERGQHELALGYVALSVVGSLVAIFAGLALVRVITA